MEFTQEIVQTLTPFHIVITFSLIVIAALLGVAAPISRGEVAFKWGNFLVSVGTSILVGFIVFLFLKTFKISDEYVAGTCGLFSYFGTKTVNVLYAALISIVINKIQTNITNQIDKKD